MGANGIVAELSGAILVVAAVALANLALAAALRRQLRAKRLELV